MPDDFQRRLASVERMMAEIKPEDIRVCVIGTVIDRTEDGNRFVLDDGTGKVTVSSDSSPQLNQIVRVFGRVIPLENGVELQGEIIQDMNSLNMELLKAVKGLKI